MVRRNFKYLLDAFLAGVGWLVADWLWAWPQLNVAGLAGWVLLASIVSYQLKLAVPLYRLTGIEEIARLGFATLFILCASLMLNLVPVLARTDSEMASIGVVASLFTGLFWVAIRVARKIWFDARLRGHRSARREARFAKRTLLVGAGQAGSLIAHEMVNHPELGYQIVGFLDDSPDVQGASINGFRVLGNCSEIEVVTARHRITHAVLAMPTAGGPTIRKIVTEFHRLHVDVKTVPGIFDLLGSREWKPDIQEIRIEDLLRREPIQLDREALSTAMEGRVVLITGAGGSIGSELARQVATLRPGAMVLLGRGENSLWQIQRNMQSLFPAQAFSLELMDIRNRNGLREVFDRYRPDIVLHTAAHKHVPFLEIYPREAVENNILGTLHVMEAARDFGSRCVANISTDKAVNPTNVLGASKRVAECIMLNVARSASPGARFVTVRFGNVLGSRGSVVPIFKEQIEQGGPVTVTHEAMTRFFMTIPEASQLVLQAALFGENGRVYVLNMGDPVRILDLATDMVKLSGLTPGRDIKIEIVGLRPGEKLHEELFMEEERSSTPVHPKLMETNPQPIPPEVLARYLDGFREAINLPYEERQPEIVRLFQELVPTYKPSLLGVGRYGGHVRDRRHTDAHFSEEMDHRGRDQTSVISGSSKT